MRVSVVNVLEWSFEDNREAVCLPCSSFYLAFLPCSRLHSRL